jgi:hypothetical protein
VGVIVGKCLAGALRAFVCSDVLATTLGPMVCDLGVVPRNLGLVPPNLAAATPRPGGVFLKRLGVKEQWGSASRVLEGVPAILLARRRTWKLYHQFWP